MCYVLTLDIHTVKSHIRVYDGYYAIFVIYTYKTPKKRKISIIKQHAGQTDSVSVRIFTYLPINSKDFNKVDNSEISQ